MKKIKFLFDLGNVFFNWDPRHFYKKIFKDVNEMEYFLNNICNDIWNNEQDAGRLIDEAEINLISKFPNYKKEIKLYYPNHRKMIKNFYNSSVEVLDFLLKKNYECYVLSNWSAETFVGMKEEYPFLKKFNGLIISGEEKLCKPDKKIYELAIKRFNLNPKKTIFIDDKHENIIAAKYLNFQTIHLKDPYKIKEMINEKL